MWTDPAGHVWTTGEMVTAANMNTYIKDNLLFLYGAPAFRAYDTGAQAIPNTTWTAVTLTSERYDPTGMHSTVSNTARGTVAVAGRYHVVAQLELAYSGVGTLRLGGIWLNGTQQIANNARDPGAGSNFSPVLSTEWAFAATDYVEMRLWQDSGGALNTVITAGYAPELSMSWQGN